MRQRMRRPIMPLFLVFSALAPTTVFSVSPDKPVANAPCYSPPLTASSHLGERSCQEYLISGAGTPDRPGALTAIDDLLRGYVENFYQGCESFLYKTAASNTDTTVITSGSSALCRRTVQRETCNRLSNGVTSVFSRRKDDPAGAPETDTNHQGSSCGDWPTFITILGGDSCTTPGDQALIRALTGDIQSACSEANQTLAETDPLTAVDVLSDSCKNSYYNLLNNTNYLSTGGGNPCIQKLIDTPSTECKITPDYSKASKFIEDSYVRGAWIQALNCYFAQVTNEVKSNGKLNLTFVQGTDSSGKPTISGPCLKIAENLQTLRDRIDQQDNLKDIENCKGTEIASSSDPGKMRQSACQLVAARKTEEALFTDVTACEIVQRALDSYLQFLSIDLATAARSEINNVQLSDMSQCSPEPVLKRYQDAYLKQLTTWGNIFWNPNSCQ